MALHGYAKAWGSFRLKRFLDVIWFKSQWLWSKSSKFYCREAVRVGSLPKKLQYLIYYFNLQIKFTEAGNSHTISYDSTTPVLKLPIPWGGREGGWGPLLLVGTIPVLSTFILGTLGRGREWALHGGTTVLIFWTPQAHIAWICGEIAVEHCTFCFSFYFWVPIAHMHCAEVCDLQICLFYYQHHFQLQNNINWTVL